MTRYLPVAIIIVVLLAAIGGGAWLYRSAQEAPRASSAATANLNANSAAAAANLKQGAVPPHVKGDDTAPVTLEEFADLQCPPCGLLHNDLAALEKEYPTRIRFIFRHFPLPTIHAHALEAAQATEAAAKQNKFWEMHDYLYENQKAWSTAQNVLPIFFAYARTLGLDEDKFARDMGSAEMLQRIRADELRGHALGVQGTPTLFLNGQLLSANDMTPTVLRERINAAIKGDNQTSPPATAKPQAANRSVKPQP